MAHAGEIPTNGVFDPRGIRSISLGVLIVVSLAFAGLITWEALAGPSGGHQMTLFLLSLSSMPLLAAVGVLLAGWSRPDSAYARGSLGLAAAAWFLTFAGLVSHAALPVVVCSIAGAALGAFSLWSGRAQMLAAWALTMNICLLAAAGFLAGVVIPTAHM